MTANMEKVCFWTVRNVLKLDCSYGRKTVNIVKTTQLYTLSG